MSSLKWLRSTDKVINDQISHVEKQMCTQIKIIDSKKRGLFLKVKQTDKLKNNSKS